LAAVIPQECDSKITVWCFDSDHGDIERQQGEIIHYPVSEADARVRRRRRRNDIKALNSMPPDGNDDRHGLPSHRCKIRKVRSSNI
jgi:hypothetical protein